MISELGSGTVPIEAIFCQLNNTPLSSGRPTFPLGRKLTHSAGRPAARPLPVEQYQVEVFKRHDAVVTVVAGDRSDRRLVLHLSVKSERAARHQEVERQILGRGCIKQGTQVEPFSLV